MPEDLLERLSQYRPTAESIASEWNASERAVALDTAMLSAAEPGARIRFVMTSPRRRNVFAPIAASVVVLGVAVGAVALVRDRGSSNSALSGGVRSHFADVLLADTAGVGPGQYSYRATHSYSLDSNGEPRPTDQQQMQNYIGRDGDVVSLRQGGFPAGCFVFRHSGTGFDQPSSAFFDSLPSDPDALRKYLIDHVSGSSSKDEAVFAAVGDMLREGDGLAPPRLRAALLDVLSTSHLVTIHQGEHDALGRLAIRADFVDQQRRPGELQSLYFDPLTFQLLEERYGSNGLPGPHGGPSYPYSATPTSTPRTDQLLSGAAAINVMTAEKVVDRLPTLPTDCERSGR